MVYKKKPLTTYGIAQLQAIGEKMEMAANDPIRVTLTKREALTKICQGMDVLRKKGLSFSEILYALKYESQSITSYGCRDFIELPSETSRGSKGGTSKEGT